ncbi:hypothetical protein V6N13_108491 [Hibiscus sabdariffa]
MFCDIVFETEELSSLPVQLDRAFISSFTCNDIVRPSASDCGKSVFRYIEIACPRCTDEKRGGIKIETWSKFQVEFKPQFYPEYMEDEA